MKIATLALSFIFLFLTVSCDKEWQNPNTTVPASELPVATLVAAPNAFNGAGVIVKGVVWDIVNDEFTYMDNNAEKTVSYSMFKLADKKGNFVTIYTESLEGVKEGDLIKVRGIYRKDMTMQKRYYANEIEAVNIQVIEPQVNAEG